MLSAHLLADSSVICWKPFNAAVLKRGAINGRKSAPTREKDKPKYMHCPKTESRRPGTPRSKSFCSTSKNWDICNMAPQYLFTFTLLYFTFQR